MTGSNVLRQEIPIANLDLDCENPRHGSVPDQRTALQRLIADQRDKIVRLAVDIHDIGVSPALLLIVTPGPEGRYTVLDGNRRLVAMQILTDPRLLPAELHSAEFTRVIAEPGSHPSAVMCAVVANRDEARIWLDRSHGGQMSGIGSIPWSSAAKYRFNPSPSARGHTASAIRVLDWIRPRLEPDDPAHTNLDTVESNSVTNLGRLAGDPDVRHLIGFDFQSGTVALNDDESAVIRRLLRIIADLAGDTTVTQLKHKPDRTAYVTKLLQDDTYGDPDPGNDERKSGSDSNTEDSATEKPAGSAGAGPADADKTKTRRRSPKPDHPFANIDVKPLHPRIQRIMAEVRQLNPDRYPNAIAVLLRAIIELTVTEYLHLKGSTPGMNTKLPTRIHTAMRMLGIPKNDADFQPLRTKLKERYSIISVPNLHQYVHNVNAAPGKSDLDSIALAYRPLLERICSDLSGQQPSST